MLSEELGELSPGQSMALDDTVRVIGDCEFEDILCKVDGDDLRRHAGLLLFWDIH